MFCNDTGVDKAVPVDTRKRETTMLGRLCRFHPWWECRGNRLHEGLQSLWASSEWQIVSDKDTCGETKVRYDDIIRSDFTICTLPDNTFKRGLCMNADLNEGDNCGFGYVSKCHLCSLERTNAL